MAGHTEGRVARPAPVLARPSGKPSACAIRLNVLTGLYAKAYSARMESAWEIEATDEVADWYESLTIGQQIALEARLALLERYGPGLRRPTIGEIKGSAFDPQMKELICDEAGAFRVLFTFDPRRHAVLLFGGDKTGQWNKWYKTAIPEADRRYRA
jgi:hypothetical protein